MLVTSIFYFTHSVFSKPSALGSLKIGIKYSRANICTLDRRQVSQKTLWEKNAGYQHFLLCLQCFHKPSSLGSLKIGIFPEQISISDSDKQTLKLSIASSFDMDECKIFLCGNDIESSLSLSLSLSLSH